MQTASRNIQQEEFHLNHETLNDDSRVMMIHERKLPLSKKKTLNSVLCFTIEFQSVLFLSSFRQKLLASELTKVYEFQEKI